MADDANTEGEWVTGVIGPSFQIDKDGNKIPGSDEQPTGEPDPDAIGKFMDAMDTGGTGDLMPTGILPGDPGQIGGNDDETQKEIWRELDRGDSGSPAGSIPDDAETTI